ncbi:MAG: hypothetical protein AAGG48_22760 [Planctomycetota bacterium]
MPRPLVFQWGEDDLSFTLHKVDRSKLYGYKELEVLDENKRLCELATLADDGRTVVGRGGTGLGQLDADGLWTEKSDLKPVDLHGDEIEPVPSSFSKPIKLFDTATPEDYLSHNVRLVYLLEIEESEHFESLREELDRGTIFTFPYSYRGGLEADAGFLLKGDDGNLFLAVGDPCEVEFIGLTQQAAVAVEDEEGVDETDLMDFDMI